MNPQQRVVSFLGLCQRAGQLTCGQEACVDLIRSGGAALAFLDGGASPNTRKRLCDACRSHGTPLYALPPGELGRGIGRPGRMAAAVGPGGMADALKTMLAGQPGLHDGPD